MNVISEKTLREFWETHPDAKIPLQVWFKMFKGTLFSDLNHVKQVFPSADYKAPLTIFNIGGNKYRLLVDINYEGQRVLIRKVLTHAEYNELNLNNKKEREEL